jgi:hypothetical protein
MKMLERKESEFSAEFKKTFKMDIFTLAFGLAPIVNPLCKRKPVN